MAKLTIIDEHHDDDSPLGRALRDGLRDEVQISSRPDFTLNEISPPPPCEHVWGVLGTADLGGMVRIDLRCVTCGQRGHEFRLFWNRNPGAG